MALGVWGVDLLCEENNSLFVAADYLNEFQIQNKWHSANHELPLLPDRFELIWFQNIYSPKNQLAVFLADLFANRVNMWYLPVLACA